MKSGASSQSRSLRKLLQDKFALVALGVILLFVLNALLTLTGVLAPGYADTVGESYLAPSGKYVLGTDVLGRSVWDRMLHGGKVALIIGFFATIIAIPIGIFFGALAGYFQKWIDEVIVWFYTTLESIPGILLILALTLVLEKGLTSICIAIGITSWVGTCRIVRGEFIRQKNLDYVQAQRALGAGHLNIMFKQILPNVYPLVLIQSSLLFVGAVKAEVILSFLGLGDPNQPSWGIMISDAKLELIGREVWWQFATATAGQFIVLLAFNILTDSLRDALDPKTQLK